MIPIKINNFNFWVKSNLSILEACQFVGIIIPRFCYHETLSVSGNCRMCLVQLNNSEKPIASCVTKITKEMNIWVSTPFVKKARENIIESLLINHPLDCPICDQGGECDLQDQTKIVGGIRSRFFFRKRGVENKYCGVFVKTIMNRCIHCTRCVRFGSEFNGSEILITLNRGGYTEIGTYVSKNILSEISGNVIDLCPVGALTSKFYAFESRPWELKVKGGSSRRADDARRKSSDDAAIRPTDPTTSPSPVVDHRRAPWCILFAALWQLHGVSAA